MVWPERGPEPRVNLGDVPVPPYFPDTPKVREAIARMYTTHMECDEKLGVLLNQLAEDGLKESTYIFHFSDHGPMPRGKRWPYDAGIHVPLIVAGPGIDEGEVNHDLVSTIDLGPTVLSLAGVEVPAHFQGQAFLGKQKKPTRGYVYASRDRYDESYDMVRAVRDGRYKYIRNYHPELPYLLWIPFRNKHPIVQELWRLHLRGELDEQQSLMFKYPRPVVELYDTVEDPHEINNLAGKSDLADIEKQLGNALDQWMVEVNDLGDIPESEMVQRWYPDGRQPQTAPPVFVPISEDNPGLDACIGGATISGVGMVQLHCATQGASIAYQIIGKGKSDQWALYSEPLCLSPGNTRLRAKACRIGYKDSIEVVAEFSANQ